MSCKGVCVYFMGMWYSCGLREEGRRYLVFNIEFEKFYNNHPYFLRSIFVFVMSVTRDEGW